MPIEADVHSAGADTGSPRYWLLVVALLAIYVYAFVDRTVLALVVDPIRHDLGASDVDMGLLLGLGFSLFFSACVIPAGHFVDRYNRRAVIGLASLFWALMTIVCGTATSLEQLFAGRAGVGIAEAVIMPASFSLIRDAVPLRVRGLAFSVYAMAPLIGAAGALLLGGHVLARAAAGGFAHLPLLGALRPWQATLVVVGAAGLPLSLLLLLAPEPRRPALAAAEPLLAGLAAALRHMRAHLGVYAPLILYVTLGAMANFSTSSWEPAVLGRSWHVPPAQAGPMLGAIVLPCGVAGLLVSGFILNRLTARGGDIRTYGLIAAAGTAIGLVGVGIAPSLAVALVMVGVGSFFLGTSFSVGASTLGQVTPAPLMGRVTAVYFLFQSLLGSALGPFLVALGSQHLFTGPTALAHSFALWCGIFGVAMIGAVIVLRRRLRRLPAAA